MRIFWVGDSPTVNTGFGIVTKNLAREFTRLGHEVVILGINHFGEPYDHKEFPYKIHPMDKGGPNEIYGLSKWFDIYKMENPDIVFFLNDPWLIQSYLQAAEKFNPYTKVVGYFPTDGGPLKKDWIETLNRLDASVCYSHYATDIITQSNGGIRPKNLRQIYHGVDTKTFHPINQQMARMQLGLPVDTFIVGMVARNQFRKRFDLLAKGFAKFAEGKTDTKLYLHCVLKDIGFDILDLAKQLKIEDKLILTENMSHQNMVPESQLNLIYNSFSVNALISLGDGFGLPVAESMATGVPQLVSNHSCLKELVEGHGGLTVKTLTWILNTSGINTWGGVSDTEDITNKLESLYADPNLRLKMAQDGYDFITQEKFQWPYAAQQFNNLFKELFHML